MFLLIAKVKRLITSKIPILKNDILNLIEYQWRLEESQNWMQSPEPGNISFDVKYLIAY